MKNNFFAYVNRMKLINRWVLMHNARPENIAEHSMMCAVLAQALADIGNTLYDRRYDVGYVALCALYHDASEVLTGDMPTPIKYNNPAIADAYKSVEQCAKDKLLGMLPVALQPVWSRYLNYEANPEVYRLVKAADTLSAYCKCLDECAMGNRDFQTAKDATLCKLQAMDLPELHYFMEHFLHGFGQPLDTLG